VNSFIYGFAVQTALGVSLWILCRLGRTTLVQPGIVVVGAVLWNLGVALGVLGILIGDGTGYEWLDMPRYASPILFAAYSIIGICALLTFHNRRERSLYVSQWFLLAALFWFPWIFSTANLLLVFAPVRGVLQAVVNWWYMNNLAMNWFGFIGLGTIFYFVPKLLGRPLFSHYYALFAFWTLALFGSWGGIHHGAPVPAWMPSVSTVFSVLALVPVIAIAINLHLTFAGKYGELTANKPLLFVTFGAFAFVGASVLRSWVSVPYMSRVLHFSFFSPAQTQLFLYGFLAMTLFGAIYYITPRIMRIEWPSYGFLNQHFWLSAIGIGIYFLSLAVGGFQQGHALLDSNKPFLDTLQPGLRMFRVSTLGDLLMAAGNVLLALNLGRMMLRCCLSCCVTPLLAAIKPETAGVKP
jgi:cytochrome c oxidase cbb3-type subunit 1